MDIGEYWGEMGMLRLVAGENQLGIEDDCAWATPGKWTQHHNYPCDEDGANCEKEIGEYKDPSFTMMPKSQSTSSTTSITESNVVIVVESSVE